MSLHADATAVLSAWRGPDAEQERLRLHYLDVLAHAPRAPYRDQRPDHLTASTLVVREDDHAVLLTLHAKAGLWLQTGGHCEEPDVTLAAAALREAREESGIDDLRLDPVPVRLSRHAVPFCGADVSPELGPTHHLDVQFVAVARTDATAVISDESADLRWFAPGDAVDPTDQDVRDLMSAARTRLRGTP